MKKLSTILLFLFCAATGFAQTLGPAQRLVDIKGTTEMYSAQAADKTFLYTNKTITINGETQEIQDNPEYSGLATETWVDEEFISNDELGHGILTVKIDGQSFANNTFDANEFENKTINIPIGNKDFVVYISGKEITRFNANSFVEVPLYITIESLDDENSVSKYLKNTYKLELDRENGVVSLTGYGDKFSFADHNLTLANNYTINSANGTVDFETVSPPTYKNDELTTTGWVYDKHYISYTPDYAGNQNSFTIGSRNGGVGSSSVALGRDVIAAGEYSIAEGAFAEAWHPYSYVWNGNPNVSYGSHANGTFNINPANGIEDFWIGNTTLKALLSNAATSGVNTVIGSRFIDVVDDGAHNLTISNTGVTTVNDKIGTVKIVNGDNVNVDTAIDGTITISAIDTIFHSTDIGITTNANNQIVSISFGDVPTNINNNNGQLSIDQNIIVHTGNIHNYAVTTLNGLNHDVTLVAASPGLSLAIEGNNLVFTNTGVTSITVGNDTLTRNIPVEGVDATSVYVDNGTVKIETDAGVKSLNTFEDTVTIIGSKYIDVANENNTITTSLKTDQIGSLQIQKNGTAIQTFDPTTVGQVIANLSIPTDLNSIDDVSLENAVENQHLVFDGSNWKNVSPPDFVASLNDLTNDVSIAVDNAGLSLSINDAQDTIILTNTGVVSLNNLRGTPTIISGTDNVTISEDTEDNANNIIVSVDAVTNVNGITDFVNIQKADNSINVSTIGNTISIGVDSIGLDKLNDVTISNPLEEKQILTYDGSEWKNLKLVATTPGISVSKVEQTVAIENTGVTSINNGTKAITLVGDNKIITITPDAVNGTITVSGRAITNINDIADYVTIQNTDNTIDVSPNSEDEHAIDISFGTVYLANLDDVVANEPENGNVLIYKDDIGWTNTTLIEYSQSVDHGATIGVLTLDGSETTIYAPTNAWSQIEFDEDNTNRFEIGTLVLNNSDEYVICIPTNVSTFYNDSEYTTQPWITQNYYNKTESDTEYINEGDAGKLKLQVNSADLSPVFDANANSTQIINIPIGTGILTLTAGNNTKTFNANASGNESFTITAADIDANAALADYLNTTYKVNIKNNQFKVDPTEGAKNFFIGNKSLESLLTDAALNGVLSVNTKTGVVQIVDAGEGSHITIGENNEGQITISADVGVTTFNNVAGTVSIKNGDNITISEPVNGEITISANPDIGVATVNTIAGDVSITGSEKIAVNNVVSVDEQENETTNIVVSLNDIALDDLSDVSIAETVNANEVLQYIDNQWTNNSLSDVAISGSYNDLLDTPNLSAVALSGSYNDLDDKPTIPDAQVQTDWDLTSGIGSILNKPNLATVATSGDYDDLLDTPNLAAVATTGDYDDLENKPTIPDAQVQTDWDLTSGIGSILNKPNLATVATSGSYTDLLNTPTIPAAQQRVDWNDTEGITSIANKPNLAAVATTGDYDDLENKPTIPAAQQRVDWNDTEGITSIANKPTLATVATSGSYTDLSNTPTIPDAQVQTDWDLTSGIGSILNKPNLAAVATSGSYTDLSNTPTIPAAQQQTDWNASSGITSIANKPTLATVATSGSYTDLSNTPTIPEAQQQVNWNATSGITSIANKPNLAAVATSGSYTDLLDTPNLATVATTGDYDDLENKPTIPAAQQQTDWNATSGITSIANKPNLATVATSGSYNDLDNKPTIPAAQQQTDWNASSGITSILNKPTLATVATTGDYDDLTDKPTLATVATSGSYNDLDDKPTIPAAQQQVNWNATSGITSIANKPTLATVATTGDYDDLENKPTIPAAQQQTDWNASSGITSIANKPTLATVATSGSYNDLANKPTIPAVYDGTLTITKDNESYQTFTANQNGSTTIDIPSKVSSLSDVSLYNLGYGDLLMYTGSEWINGQLDDVIKFVEDTNENLTALSFGVNNNPVRGQHSFASGEALSTIGSFSTAIGKGDIRKYNFTGEEGNNAIELDDSEYRQYFTVGDYVYFVYNNETNYYKVVELPIYAFYIDDDIAEHVSSYHNDFVMTFEAYDSSIKSFRFTTDSEDNTKIYIENPADINPYMEIGTVVTFVDPYNSTEYTYTVSEFADSAIIILDEDFCKDTESDDKICLLYGGKALGDYSFINGDSCVASGDTSHAEGKETIASGDSSHAEGYQTKATATTSHAEGKETIASGYCSHAEGTGSIASGQFSHADGSHAYASNDYSYVWSKNSSGYGSHGTGTFNINPYDGIDGFWIGENRLKDYFIQYSKDRENHLTAITSGERYFRFDAGVRSVSVGTGVVTEKPPQGTIYIKPQDNTLFDITGQFSYEYNGSDPLLELNQYMQNSGYTEGDAMQIATSEWVIETDQTSQHYGEYVPSEGGTIYDGVVTALYPGSSRKVHIVAVGVRPMAAVGDYSVAVGNSTLAMADYSVALGGYSASYGIGAISVGDNCFAYGDYSSAKGKYSTTFGEASIAEGDHCFAGGNSSLAAGRYSHAVGDYSYAQGDHAIATEDNSFAIGQYTISSNDYAYVWNGEPLSDRDPLPRSQSTNEFPELSKYYGSHGAGTYNVNPANGVDGFYVGDDKLSTVIYNTACSIEQPIKTYTESDVNNNNISISINDVNTIHCRAMSLVQTAHIQLPTISKSLRNRLYEVEFYIQECNGHHYDFSTDNIQGLPNPQTWASASVDETWHIRFKSIPGTTNWYYIDSTKYEIESYDSVTPDYFFTFESGNPGDGNTYASNTSDITNTGMLSSTEPTVTFKVNRVLRGKDSSTDKFNGTHSLRMAPVKDNTPAYIYNNAAFGAPISKISFMYAKGVSGDICNSFKVYVSSDGTSWSELVDLTSSVTTTLQEYTTSNIPENSYYIKFENINTSTTTNNRRLSVDDIKIWLEEE